jgi:predicted dehydrogenase
LGRSKIMESSLRVGLIGVGKHGSRYAKHIREDLPEIDLIGLWRRNAGEGKKQARQYGCRYFHTYSDLLSDNSIDAVVVALPPALNRAICEEAAYRGKHILLEKPMAINVGEAIRICQVVSRCSVHLMVSQTLRFNTAVRAVKDRIPQLGSLHSIHLTKGLSPPPWPGWIKKILLGEESSYTLESIASIFSVFSPKRRLIRYHAGLIGSSQGVRRIISRPL